MSIQLQIVLIVLTVLLFLYLIREVRKGRLRTDYAVGWIFSSIALVIVAVFPQIPVFGAKLLGVISTANIVFAFIIMLLIILVYLLFAKVSILEEKQKNLIQEIGLLKEKNNLKK